MSENGAIGIKGEKWRWVCRGNRGSHLGGPLGGNTRSCACGNGCRSGRDRNRSRRSWRDLWNLSLKLVEYAHQGGDELLCGVHTVVVVDVLGT